LCHRCASGGAIAIAVLVVRLVAVIVLLNSIGHGTLALAIVVVQVRA